MRKTTVFLLLFLVLSSPAFGQIVSLPANPTFQNLFIQSGGFIDFGSPGALGDSRVTHALGAGLRLTGSAPTLNLGTGLTGDPTGILCVNSFSAALNRPLCLDAAAKKISLPSDLLIEGTSTSLRYWDGAAYRTGFSLQAGSGGITFTANTGMVFGDLGTATRGIDLSGSGLSGDTDYWFYGSVYNFWTASGIAQLDYIKTSRIERALTNRDLGFYPPSGDSFGNWVWKLIHKNTNIQFGDITGVGSLAACTSNGTTTITKATHGLTLAAGELVHITGATTAADKGFYRIISSDANTIVVDRALAGSDADVALVVYKDVIGIFATDGTNGQRIMNYSAQNKPLQLGGDTLATTATLTSKDVFIGGEIGLSSTTAAGAQAGTIATTPTAGNPGKYFKVYDAAGAAWAIPAWAIP